MSTIQSGVQTVSPLTVNSDPSQISSQLKQQIELQKRMGASSVFEPTSFQTLLAGIFGNRPQSLEPQGGSITMSAQEFASTITESITRAVTSVISAVMEKVMALVSSLKESMVPGAQGTEAVGSAPTASTSGSSAEATQDPAASSSTGAGTSAEQSSSAENASNTASKEGRFEAFMSKAEQVKDFFFNKETGIVTVLKDLIPMFPGAKKVVGKLIRRLPNLLSSGKGLLKKAGSSVMRLFSKAKDVLGKIF
jgi:hypothetical protein